MPAIDDVRGIAAPLGGRRSGARDGRRRGRVEYPAARAAKGSEARVGEKESPKTPSRRGAGERRPGRGGAGVAAAADGGADAVGASSGGGALAAAAAVAAGEGGLFARRSSRLPHEEQRRRQRDRPRHRIATPAAPPSAPSSRTTRPSPRSSGTVAIVRRRRAPHPARSSVPRIRSTDASARREPERPERRPRSSPRSGSVGRASFSRHRATHRSRPGGHVGAEARAAAAAGRRDVMASSVTRLAVERRLPGQELEEDDARAPRCRVRASTSLRRPHLLGRHVERASP